MDDNIKPLPSKTSEFAKLVRQAADDLEATLIFQRQLAKTRRALYNAYVSEGFTKHEAFQLVKTELLKINFSIEE